MTIRTPSIRPSVGRIPRSCCPSAKDRLIVILVAFRRSPSLAVSSYLAHSARSAHFVFWFELFVTIRCRKKSCRSFPNSSDIVFASGGDQRVECVSRNIAEPRARGALSLYFARSLSPAHGLSLCISTPGTKHKTPCGLRVSRGTSSS